MTKEEFFNTVLRLRHEFYVENGKPPNELHIGRDWADAYDEFFEDFDTKYDIQAPYKRDKHWWFMGMRCFHEHWTHSVEWTENTEKIKKSFDGETMKATQSDCERIQKWLDDNCPELKAKVQDREFDAIVQFQHATEIQLYQFHPAEYVKNEILGAIYEYIGMLTVLAESIRNKP